MRVAESVVQALVRTWKRLYRGCVGGGVVQGLYRSCIGVVWGWAKGCTAI